MAQDFLLLCWLLHMHLIIEKTFINILDSMKQAMFALLQKLIQQLKLDVLWHNCTNIIECLWQWQWGEKRWTS